MRRRARYFSRELVRTAAVGRRYARFLGDAHTLQDLMSRVHVQLVGIAALFTCGTVGSSLAVLAEAAHQVLDATADAALLEALCRSLWRPSDELSFGTVRLSTLVRFGTATCTMAACLLLTIEIVHRSLHLEAPAPHILHVAAAGTAPVLLCRCALWLQQDAAGRCASLYYNADKSLDLMLASQEQVASLPRARVCA